MIAMGLMGDLALIRSSLTLIGHLPAAATIMVGFAIGGLTSWAGWNAGRRPLAAVAGNARPAGAG